MANRGRFPLAKERPGDTAVDTSRGPEGLSWALKMDAQPISTMDPLLGIRHWRGVRTRPAGTLHDRSLIWIEKHSRLVWIVLVIAALLLRWLLVSHSPRPDGYTYDFYFEGVERFNRTGRLPVAADCWQCYHPPLFYLLGAAFYQLGWLASGTRHGALLGLSALSLVSGAITSGYSIALLRLFRQRGAHLLLGAAIVLAFPCLFISSWSAEADSLQTAILAAFLFYLTKYDLTRGQKGWQLAIVVGLISGLAMATKYNGLLALGTSGIILFLRVLTGPRRLPTIRDGLIILTIALAVGGWKYVDNTRRYGTALFANGPAAEGFAVASFRHWDKYDYVSLRIIEVARLYQPGAPPGRLTDQEVYYSVPTALHAMAWTDMSFFSVKQRHGDPSQPYPDKAIPRWLVIAILILGLVPNLLALIGLTTTLVRRSLRACATLTALTVVSYVAWFTAQEAWALKTKYLLYLLPAYTLYVLFGLRVVRRGPTLVSDGFLLGLFLLIAAAHLFLFAFAVGSVSAFRN
jgi:4-amino-4-deoxy-L-arabinose transferase-like glycosyltransferase